MPIIEGYDNLDLGPAKFPEGVHKNVTVSGCKYETGRAKNGNAYYALDVTITGDHASERVRVWIPANTAEWASWSDGKRKATKSQLTALGIDMSEVESESARAAVINQSIDVEVKLNGEYRNLYFREASGMDSGSGLPAPAVPLEGAAGTPNAGQPQAVIV